MAFYLDNQPLPNETTLIENERRNAHRAYNEMMTSMVRQEPVTVGELSERLGDIPEDDLVSLIIRDMIIPDAMKLVEGQVEVLDNYHAKIKYRFQNALIKYQNNQELLIKAFFYDAIDFFDKQLLEEHPSNVYEGFDVKLVA